MVLELITHDVSTFSSSDLSNYLATTTNMSFPSSFPTTDHPNTGRAPAPVSGPRLPEHVRVLISGIVEQAITAITRSIFSRIICSNDYARFSRSSQAVLEVLTPMVSFAPFSRPSLHQLHGGTFVDKILAFRTPTASTFHHCIPMTPRAPSNARPPSFDTTI